MLNKIVAFFEGVVSMKKVCLGVLLGIVVGIIDVIPMVIQKITWDANLSAFFHWVVVGFFISSVNLKVKGVVKGLLVSVITLIPIAFLVWWKDTSSIIPMSVSTLVFGSLLGFLIDKYGRQ